MAERKERRYLSENAPLMAEWDWEKNNELDFDPKILTLGSHKKVWWKCSKGHEWKAAISDRNSGTGCPYCSGNKVLKGYNDIGTVNPVLAEEWNVEKNGELTPNDVTPNSSKKVWWKCSNGHEWISKISHRSNGSTCPYCSGLYPIKGENDLQTINPTLSLEWNYEKNGELTPMDVLPNSGKKVWWKCNKGHEWQATIANRNKGIECPICNSERKTSFPEYVLIYYLRKYGLDVMHSYRELGYELDVFIPSKKVAIEYDGYYWHKNKTAKDLDKNKRCVEHGIKLYRIREGLPVLYDSSIDYVVQKNLLNLAIIIKKVLSEIVDACVDINLDRDTIAIESMREYSEKELSLLSSSSKVASEWNYEKNGSLKPEHVTANSNKRVWWKCSNGHEWQAKISDKNSGTGCPYCSGLYPIKGENDLQTINPTLSLEWNYEKNGELTPCDVTPYSSKKVWWKCNNDHEWQAIIKHRSNGSGCPYCSGRNAIEGENDLQTINPTLAKEWNYERNVGITPNDVKPSSGKVVWWKCGEGHEWKAAIANRNQGRGCPFCSSKKVLQGYNDLQTINPTLAKEWNHEKNNGLTPSEVLPNSHKKAWWKCQKGHEWQATIGSRNRGNGCPICAKEKRKKSK